MLESFFRRLYSPCMIGFLSISDIVLHFKWLEIDLFQEKALYTWHAVCFYLLGEGDDRSVRGEC
jgi:hypothetical protein